MIKQTIYTTKAPTPSNYSQGRRIDTTQCYLLLIAGQTGSLPPSENESEAPVDGVTAQTYQALKNIEAIVLEARGQMCDIDYMDVFLQSMKDKSRFEEGYRTFFEERKIPFPPRCTVQAGIPLASEDTLVELRATAYIPKTR